ncbi:fasciclin-3 isoform X3 [Lutzomyia longipalpis]|uniref:fasciclin-3 isoform X3 n=1 Tax=Lutzomyia longipalpis TaxID=7200 RepID=UPI002483CE8F|nr:fasciclin-3 isoform X3 [Lutzomyia longipalpis]
MDTKMFAKSLISVIMLTGALTLAQRVDVTPQQVIARVGEPASILCRAGRQIQYCRIVIPGEKVLNLAPNWTQRPGFPYNGEGLQAGQCGVTIERVKTTNHGPVECFLGVEGDEISGVADLVVALEPQRPQLEILTQGRNGAFEVDTEFQAKCISHDGRPPANLTWFLDDENIFDGLTMPEVVESHDRNNATLYTVVQGIQRFIRVSDDRRNLICRANHFSYPQGYLDSRIQLLVRYRPQPLPLVKLYGLILGSTGLVNVTIRANPRPLTEWHVAGNTIQQGSRNGRYEAYEPQDLGRGEFNVALSIAGLTLEDTTKEYLLRASNEFGTTDYQVRISSSEAAPAAGLGVGPIIGIVIAVLVILIIIGLIVVARATGRWCFSDNSGARPSETEHEPEARASLLSRIKPSSLVAKVMPVKHEALESQAQQGGPTPTGDDDQHPRDSEETVIITDEVTEPKEEDSKPNIVYAELMLKPSPEGKAPPQKTPTEYAEIVYPKSQKSTTDAKTN